MFHDYSHEYLTSFSVLGSVSIPSRRNRFRFDELERWKRLSPDVYAPFVDEGGLLNEFAMMWALRDSFPLHFHVFKQTACHLPHERS